MRKTLSWIMVLIICVGMLSGCVGNRTKSDIKNGQAQTDNMENSVELKMIMISMGLNLDDAKKVESAMNDIIYPEINATIDIEWIDMGDLVNQMNLKLTSGDVIDILPTFAMYVSMYYSMGALSPMTELVQTYGQDILEVVGEEYLQCGYINGELYGIPCVDCFARQYSFYYRVDLAEKYDIDMSSVNTLSDLTSVFEIMHQADPELNLLVSNNPTDPMLIQFGWDGLGDEYGVLMDPVNSTKVENLYATDEYEAYVTLMHEWYKAGYIQSDAATTADNIQTLLGAGNAFGFLYRSYPGEVEKESNNCGYELAEIVLRDSLATTSTVADPVMTIPTSSANPQKAMEFINLLYTNEALTNLLYYGIEGMHYQKVSDNQITYIDGEDMMTCKYANRFMIGNQLIGYLDVSLPADLNERIATFNENSAVSKALGFSYDSSSVANELAVLETVVAKYRRGLECGSLNPETELPKFLEELEAAGIQSVIDTKQAQLDQWIAEK